MAKVTLYNKDGQSVGELLLDAGIFEVEVNPALVHEAVIAQQANARQVLAHTKDRSDVAGTGKKPWKQKGTGRARHGSRRSPIWSGGGITFGPRSDRNFSKKINRKARQKALAMVLTDKVSNDRFIAVEDLKIDDAKTKNLAAVLKKLPVAEKKTLIVLAPENVSTARAAKNIQGISTIPVHSINIVELLAHPYVLISKDAVEILIKNYQQ